MTCGSFVGLKGNFKCFLSACARGQWGARGRETRVGNGGPFTCKTLDYSLSFKKLNQRQIAWTLETPTQLFNGEVNNECVCVRVC